MNANRNTKIGVLAVSAAALAAGGAAFAASKNGGGSQPAASGLQTGYFVSSQAAATHADHGPGPGHGPSDDFAAAATYLGVTQSALETQLQAGKTLGEIADATSGKSKAGLVAALVAAEKKELAQAVTDGKLTQAQADQITTGLTQRFTDMANGVRPDHGGPGGPGFGGHGGHGGDELAAAATYLGVSQSALETQLQAGKTLGQIADATSGKSKAGLIEALVAAEKKELTQAVTGGKLTQAQVDQITTGLTQRFTDMANGVRPDHGGPGFGGPGFGGPPPPAGSSSQGTTHI